MNKSKLFLLALGMSLPALTYSMTPHEQLSEYTHEQLVEILNNFDEYTDEQMDEIMNKLAKENANRRLKEALTDGNIWEIGVALMQGADINVQGDCGRNLLHVSIAKIDLLFDKENAVKNLLEKGVDVNTQTKDNETPLHVAVCCGNTNAVKLLLEYGADQTLRDKNGETALDAAKRLGKQEIIQVLRQYQSLKQLGIEAVRKLVKENKLTLEQVKNSVPQEVAEYL